MSWDLPRYPAVTETDRQAIAQRLGLSGFEFLYLERAGSQILRAWHINAQGQQALFTPEDLELDPQLPRVVLNHPGQSVAERAPFAAESLAEMLLPFPYRLWFERPRAEAGGSWECTDAAWAQAIAVLTSAFQALEHALHRTEISVLEFAAPDQAPVTLFFHCVRRRFLAVGILPTTEADENLRRLGASFQRIRLSPVQLSHLPSQADELAQVFESLLSKPALEAPAPEAQPTLLAPLPL